MFLSVIIPVYNVESYLGRCIDSVVAQNMGNEIELLLIDDGSKDASGSICDEYASKYDWIHVFHIPNGGVGNARNYGMTRVHGDYFTFIDSDDFLEPGVYQEVYRLYKLKPSDVYTFGYKDYPAESGSVHVLQEGHFDTPNLLAHHYLNMKQNYLMFSVINKIFNFVDNRCSRFPTNLHYFEDCLFVLECLKRANSVCEIGIPAYNYVHHPGEHLGAKYTEPEVIVKVARELKKRSDLLPQCEELTRYTIFEYYNNLLHAVDSSRGVKQKYQYVCILWEEIKRFGFLKDFRRYLGKRKMLLLFPNPICLLLMCYIRILLLKLR